MIETIFFPRSLPIWDRNVMRSLAITVLDLDWKVTSINPDTLALITWTPKEINDTCVAIFGEHW